MSGSSKNLKLWLVLAAVPIVLSFIIVGYAKYEYDDQAKTATSDVDDWEPNERENERIARREVLDTEENSILLNIADEDINSQEILPTKYEIEEEEKLELNGAGDPVVYEVDHGEWLASIALKLYGSKAFWGYIYEVNRDMLSSPDDVKAGMELYLPNKDFYHIDSTNTQSIQEAAKVSASFLSE